MKIKTAIKQRISLLLERPKALPLETALAVWQEPICKKRKSAPLVSVRLHFVKGRVVFALQISTL